MHWHEPTQAYVERRTAEGKTKPEIMRCLKRYLAREVCRCLVPAAVSHPHPTKRAWNRPLDKHRSINAFSAAPFKSVKYCPAFPKTFASLGHARGFCASFFEAYNFDHRHQGLGLLTPNVVHTGQAETVRAARAVVLNAAHTRHTNRFNHPPQPPRLPESAWINRPDSSETEAHK